MKKYLKKTHGPWSLKHVPDNLKTREMCKKAVEKGKYTLRLVPNDPRFWETYEKGVEKYPWLLKNVLDNLKI